ncbi:Pentatricopeptide repeat-containing protein, chloroplastic [Vitis vinifera]|uniref:Pentatricopeptide repeat-containing protein, chloroplastic n=1 Tax=Vitis vinifera TaxID=29760 RepID=A0A438CI29_VITVI|nr:Pentatricopeptide repeat-containing protein, chloroplastic [Vitis vinifera]
MAATALCNHSGELEIVQLYHGHGRNSDNTPKFFSFCTYERKSTTIYRFQGGKNTDREDHDNSLSSLSSPTPPPTFFQNPSRQNIIPSSLSLSLKNPNFEPLKNRLIRQLDVGRLHHAFSTLDLMTQQNAPPDLTTYSILLKSCIRFRNFQLGKLVHRKLMQSGLELYSKCGDTETARLIFEGMGNKRDLVSWSAMVSCFANNSMELQAIWTFLDMLELGFYPNEYCFAAVIRACSNPITPGVVVIWAQLISLVTCMQSVQQMGQWMIRGRYLQMPEHNVMSWTAIITAYVQSGECDKEAIELFCKMISGHIRPNHFSFSSVLKACGNLSDPYTGEQVYSYAVKLGIASVNCVGNSLISMYARSGRMEDARKAFDILFEKNLVSYNAIVDGYAKNLKSEEAFLLFNEIADTGIGISAFTFASVEWGCKYRCNGQRCGNIEAAFQVFNEMEDGM